MEQAALRLAPSGTLAVAADSHAAALAPDLYEVLAPAFARGTGHGLLELGARGAGLPLPAVWAWWRAFAARFVSALCAMGSQPIAPVAPPAPGNLAALCDTAVPMAGGEYLSEPVLLGLWQAMADALRLELQESGDTLPIFLSARNSAWHLVGRVHFNVAENRADTESPFAFLATYTTGLSALGRAQHQPLARALSELSDGNSQAQLLALLQPVQRAAASVGWLSELVAKRELFAPLRWTAQEVWQLLCDAPALEAAGVVLRLPAVWRSGRPQRAVVKVNIGAKAPSALGMAALLDFDMAVSLDGEPLDEREVAQLLASQQGLHFIRGQWVEVDAQKLKSSLRRFDALRAASEHGGLGLAQGLRLIADVSLASAAPAEARLADWQQLHAGPWLAQVLHDLRQPQGLADIEPGEQLLATLRPYQQAGLRWLYLLTQLRLGACLADDMGLGKTIQVIALLLVLKREHRGPAQASLLVVPASLLGNWAAEAARFAPSLRLCVVHPSAMPASQLGAFGQHQASGYDLVVTTYGTLLRLPALSTADWRLVVIDEAQAIKNPGARQTRQVKLLNAQCRIALTGTPVENRLSDLWSIFDFTNPGLLGSGKDYAALTKRLELAANFEPLRKLVAPYILRRLKTDKRVIDDLPDKIEMNAWCGLSHAQAIQYQQAVQALSESLADVGGIARKGAVLAALMRFKQICNHPSQWLGDGAWAPQDSGKFGRLREIAEVIAAKQEKLLVFTQFREATAPLAAFLGDVFGRPGLVLHGATPVAQRRELVARFQSDEAVPFFVLSLKAGGAGLNLTAASHVVHFDRWWNPAVENQATDRAFRIGQRKNVLVHKFICRGTVEDRIDQLIASKQQLATDVLSAGAEVLLTEMDDTALLDLVRLDIQASQMDAG